GGKQPQIWFGKEIIGSLISSNERKDTPVPRNYFIPYKSSDVSRMEGQHGHNTRNINYANTEACRLQFPPN
ncbi:hypothetical protein AVEN_200892-1, partial [Araneus ventricosus]